MMRLQLRTSIDGAFEGGIFPFLRLTAEEYNAYHPFF